MVDHVGGQSGLKQQFRLIIQVKARSPFIFGSAAPGQEGEEAEGGKASG
jgi:hypothetical protein